MKRNTEMNYFFLSSADIGPISLEGKESRKSQLEDVTFVLHQTLRSASVRASGLSAVHPSNQQAETLEKRRHKPPGNNLLEFDRFAI